MAKTGTWASGRLKYYLVLPIIALMVTVFLGPAIYATYLSFTGASLGNYLSPNFVGLSNYGVILVSPGWYWGSILVTFQFVLITVSVESALGFGLAYLIRYHVTKYRGIIISLLILPFGVPPVLAGLVYKLMWDPFAGILPLLSSIIGIGLPSPFSGQQAIYSVALLNIWLYTPIVLLICYAAFSTVGQDLLDAARVDGAGALAQLRRVIWPVTRPQVLIAIAIVTFLEIRELPTIWVVTQGGPSTNPPLGATTTLTSLIYLLAFSLNEFGLASAATAITLLIISTLVSMVFWRYLEVKE